MAPHRYAATMLVVFSLISSAAIAQDEVRCNYKRGWSCGPVGCKDFLDKDAYLLMPRLEEQVHATALADDHQPYANYPTVRRCAVEGCYASKVRAVSHGDSIDLLGSDSAYFVHFAVTKAAAAAGGERGDFMEILVGPWGTNTYYGSCKTALGEPPDLSQ